MLGQEEVFSALQAEGSLTINCDYCGKTYLFDQVDCEALFKTAGNPNPSETRH